MDGAPGLFDPIAPLRTSATMGRWPRPDRRVSIWSLRVPPSIHRRPGEHRPWSGTAGAQRSSLTCDEDGQGTGQERPRNCSSLLARYGLVAAQAAR